MLPIIIQGKYMMIPLMALSLVSIAVIIERYSAFKAATVDTTALRAEVLALLRNGDVRQAIVLCSNTPGPVSAILLVGLRKYEKMVEMGKDMDAIDALVTKAMTDYAPHIVEVLENRLNILALVGTISPLLGMTGTVTGMINSFKSIVEAGNMDATMVAGGIAEALITTAGGLIIAIPAVVMYNIYTRKVERFVLEIEEAATKLVDFVTTGAE